MCERPILEGELIKSFYMVEKEEGLVSPVKVAPEKEIQSV